MNKYINIDYTKFQEILKIFSGKELVKSFPWIQAESQFTVYVTCFFFLNCNLIYLFIYFWLCWVFVSVRGLSLVAASGGHSSSRCAGLFIIAASLVGEHRLQTSRLSSCGSRAQLLRGMWDPPRPGLEPVSPALAGRFSTTAPPGKPVTCFYTDNFC